MWFIAVNMAMRKLLSILGIIISICFISCKGKPGSTDSTSAGSNGTAGGGAAHIDSLKTIGTGVNGETSNTLDTKDTLINGHSVASPADSGKNKKH